jgi:hypothetical protein
LDLIHLLFQKDKIGRFYLIRTISKELDLIVWQHRKKISCHFLPAGGSTGARFVLQVLFNEKSECSE